MIFRSFPRKLGCACFESLPSFIGQKQHLPWRVAVSLFFQKHCAHLPKLKSCQFTFVVPSYCKL
jgi:hypothetical protein